MSAINPSIHVKNSSHIDHPFRVGVRIFPDVGESRKYYRNGKLKAVVYYVNGKLNGDVKLYKETGELDKIERFKDGKKID